MSSVIPRSGPAEQGRQTVQEILARLDAVMEQVGAGADRTLQAIDRSVSSQRALVGRIGADQTGVADATRWLTSVADALVQGAGRGVRLAADVVRDPALVVGASVEVRYLADRWSRGFEIVERVAEQGAERFRLLRRSDRTVLPRLFLVEEIRAEKPCEHRLA